MATFQVYKDVDNQTKPMKTKSVKLKETKVDLGSRTVFGEIDQNKVLHPKPQSSKAYDLKISNRHEKDVSEAFKEVNLNDEDEIENKCGKKISFLNLFRSNNCVDPEESNSDISLDISASEIDEKHSYFYRIKLHTDLLYDCLQYRDDIFSYLRELELKRKPKPFYMKKQPDITSTMRSILVDWMVEVAEEYKLQGETLFMAVSYVDRFLSKMAVMRNKLQLLGTAAMFVAAKYEEIYPPKVSEFTFITDDTYTKKQVLRMEQLLLKSLKFEISVPTHHTFITHLTKVTDIESNVSSLALYICELTLKEGDPYLRYPPSQVACGAIALARHCLCHVEAWPEELESISGYSLHLHLVEILPHLNATHSKASFLSLTASREKYKSNTRFGVSLINHKPLIVKKPKAS